MKKTTTTKRTAATHYKAVGKNIYFDGTSYRTRVTIDGERNSRSFPTKNKAIQYRNSLLGA
jgi:hypothetical protein